MELYWCLVMVHFGKAESLLHYKLLCPPGDCGVGKTALVQMLASKGAKFPKDYSMVRKCHLMNVSAAYHVQLSSTSCKRHCAD